MEDHVQYLTECLEALVIAGEGAREMLEDPLVSGSSDALLRMRVAQGRHAEAMVKALSIEGDPRCKTLHGLQWMTTRYEKLDACVPLVFCSALGCFEELKP